ncbi:MAG: hypothetical protein FD171_18 [Actinobacteria bacterium]|nr:MAG: hypothetical protein FD171_18 [Actinomycetota bacterium]
MNRNSRMIRIAAAGGLLLALGLLAACAAEPPATKAEPGAVVDPGTADPTAPVETPTVRITIPAGGAKVPAGTVTVAVETTGLEFVMPGGTNVAGQGHVHFSLDGGPIVMSVEKEAELKDVAPGTHTLVAELVQNDTESFSPPIEQEIEFVVE